MDGRTYKGRIFFMTSKSQIAKEIDTVLNSRGTQTIDYSAAKVLLDEAILMAKTELRGHAILETLVMLRKELFGR
jgi:hypothetical protein